MILIKRRQDMEKFFNYETTQKETYRGYTIGKTTLNSPQARCRIGVEIDREFHTFFDLSTAKTFIDDYIDDNKEVAKGIDTPWERISRYRIKNVIFPFWDQYKNYVDLKYINNRFYIRGGEKVKDEIFNKDVFKAFEEQGE